MAANTLRPPPSALQPPPTAGIAEQPPQTAAGIAEQPPHGLVTCTALQPQALTAKAALLCHPAGAALPRQPAVRTQQQPHHSATGLAAQPYGYFDAVPVLEQIHSLPPLPPHLTRFKAEKANIIGCNDQVAYSAFKKGLPIEHELYRELAITPSQTLAEVFRTAERYALWDDDRIVAKKASKQVDHPTRQACQKSNKFESKTKDKRRSRPQEGCSETGTFTEFIIPIHQILAQVKDKPWVRRPPPMRGDPSRRDTSKYSAFHGEHGHYTNNCNAWKRHLEELVRDGHCTEFVAKKAIQQIEDRDAVAKEPPQKVIWINTILANFQEFGLTTKEHKRKIAQATYVSQVTTGVPVIADTPIIGFQKKDLIGLDLPHNDALVICIQIEQAVIERVHVDEGSAANILQLSVI
ncbi:uncharacterized protein LOC110769214 [Prunus avium]|uniref:Uncharacterized protein LOC110769214 n=1 Tax=Prunus avium TaxID=42229 RepID=A0A6P5TNZ0_PRUAV|nr:uncharacterized protein LOC110769214 [Prunus avium]